MFSAEPYQLPWISSQDVKLNPAEGGYLISLFESEPLQEFKLCIFRRCSFSFFIFLCSLSQPRAMHNLRSSLESFNLFDTAAQRLISAFIDDTSQVIYVVPVLAAQPKDLLNADQRRAASLSNRKGFLLFRNALVLALFCRLPGLRKYHAFSRGALNNNRLSPTA